MNVTQALSNINRLFLDTAPVIYYVEKNPQYLPQTDAIFNLLDQGAFTAVTSPITLAECLVYPYRQGNVRVQQDFTELIVHGYSTLCIGIDEKVGVKAAQLRASYNLVLPDALQIACALAAGCDAFLSNDIALKRVSEMPVLILDELTV